VIPRGRSCSPWSDSWEAFPHGGAHPPAEVLMITSIANTGAGFAVLRKRRCWWCAWQRDDDVRVMQLVEGLDVRISCRETLGKPSPMKLHTLLMKYAIELAHTLKTSIRVARRIPHVIQHLAGFE
jgi:hypothetical protein